MYKMNRIVSFLLLISAGIVLYAQSLDDVRKHLSYDQLPQALSKMEAIAKANPGNIQYQILLGDIYAMNQQHDKAISAWKLASEINPSDNYALIAAARVQLPVNITEAQKLFDRVIRNTKSRNAHIFQSIGESFLYAKNPDLDKAIDNLNKALSIDRSDASTFLSLAEAYMLKRDFGSAMTNYDYAAERTSNKSEPYYKMGTMYIRARNYPLGVSYLERAQQADPNFPAIYKALGNHYYENVNDYGKAVEQYKKYISLITPDKDDLARYANALHAAGKYSEAIQVITDIVSKDPSAVYLYKVISESYNKLDQLDKGLEYMKKYVASLPKDKVDPNDLVRIAVIYRNMQNDSMALEYFDKALEIDSKITDALDQVISILNEQRKFQESIKYLSMKASLPGAGAMDYFNLGRAYYITRDYSGADAAFRKIIDVRPDAATGYLWSAKSSANLDPELETGIAVPMYEKFIEVALPNRETFAKELSEAYGYLAYYHYMKHADIPTAKDMAQKAVDIDPSNEQAGEMLKAFQ